MRLSRYLHTLLTERLNQRRILVWYDGERAFGDFAARFTAPNCRIVSGQTSRLQARREAEAVYRQLNASPNRLEAEANLLIYLPFARHTDPDKRRQDPFEVFAMAGDSFGDDAAETLQSLAHQAMPELTAQIGRLFREGRPTLAMLDRLDTSGPAYPLCQQTLGTQSPVAIVARLLGDGGQTAVPILLNPDFHGDAVEIRATDGETGVVYGRLTLKNGRDEWLDALLRSTGLEPASMDHRLKLLLLTRLIPFVEKNYSFIELGPRGTGKSYVYSEMSPYCILISGGKAISANLFYNNARRQVGLVGHWDLVAFDEVGGMRVNDPDTIQIMKDYMANGRFSRGVTQVMADASLVFVGNLNQPVETLVQNSATDLFQPLPKEFDLAVIDRLHFYLPGWEIPKNSKSLLTTHYGFVTDYLAEAFRALRKQNLFDAVERYYRFGSHVEGRDASAVKRTVAGLLKLLRPDGAYTKLELEEYLELALEGRRRVREQLKKRGSFEFYCTSFS